MKALLALLIVLACAVGGYFYFKPKGGEGGAAGAGAPSMAQMPPAEVEVMTVRVRPLDLTTELPGRTAAYKIAEIRPQVSGIVTKRLFEEGSDIKAGQQLYQIDPSTYQAAFDSAQADRMKAEANAKSIVSRSTRYEQLVKIGGVSKQEYDDIRANLAQAQADIAIAEARLAETKINLDYTKVFSPIPGRIGKSQVTEGALVTQNQTQTLATVQQLDPIYVDVTQSSAELMALQRSFADKNLATETPVTLAVEGDNQNFDQKGRLQFSDVSVDPTSGSVQLRILFPNPRHTLLPGLFVRARIAREHIDQAIVVPQKAVSRAADGTTSVSVVGPDNKVEMRPVTVAETVGDSWLLKTGPNPGDRIVVEGLMKAAPGSVVKPVEAGAPAAAAPGAVPDAPAEADASKR